MVSLEFFINITLPATLRPWGRLSIQWVPGTFPGSKGGWYLGLTTLPPSCADCLAIWESQPPGILRGCPGLWWDCSTFLPFIKKHNGMSSINKFELKVFVLLLKDSKQSKYFRLTKHDFLMCPDTRPSCILLRGDSRSCAQNWSWPPSGSQLSLSPASSCASPGPNPSSTLESKYKLRAMYQDSLYGLHNFLPVLIHV